MSALTSVPDLEPRPTLAAVYVEAAKFLGMLIKLPDAELATAWGQMLGAHIVAIGLDVSDRARHADWAARVRAAEERSEVAA
jgi:hypothetical protein